MVCISSCFYSHTGTILHWLDTEIKQRGFNLYEPSPFTCSHVLVAKKPEGLWESLKQLQSAIFMIDIQKKNKNHMHHS